MPIVQHPNAVSFSDLVTEFGGEQGPPAPPATRMPIPLSSYYAGGLYVNANTQGFPLGNTVNIPSSGAISVGNFHGSRKQFEFTISGVATEVNLRISAISAGWDQTSRVRATNSGVIRAGSVGTYALTINGSFPGGVDFINNGTIVGCGGTGGTGGAAVPTDAGSQTGWANGINGNPATPGSGAGPALLVSVPVTILNNGRIAGGGGGGGGGGNGASSHSRSSSGVAGGGGGGGTGNGSFGPNGSQVNIGGLTRFAGPGANGSDLAPGTGGLGGYQPPNISGFFREGGTGGTGGSFGSTGATGGVWTGNPGPHAIRPPGVGGAGGAAIVGNGNITWAGFGTINGGVV